MLAKEKTKKSRREIMQSVHSKNTKPEKAVRSLIYSLGYRYRIHRRNLPGNPDIVFMKIKKVIFVHGCFWHGHDCSAGRNQPKSNSAYWVPKLKRTIERDKENMTQLKNDGWGVLIIWECQIKNQDFITKEVCHFLGGL